MANIGTVSGFLVLHDRFTGPLKKATGQLAVSGKKMQAIGQKMTVAGASMTRALTVPIALIGVGAVVAFAKFDDKMTESLAIMGDVSDAMKEDMAKTARETALTVEASAAQMAEGYFFLASAGLSAAAAIEVLPTVAKFAQAGTFDLALATDLLTDAQSALGLTIRDDVVKNMENMVRVSDVLVKANTLANASVEQFSVALTTEAGAALKSFNKDIEEGVAVLAAFADQGVKGQIAGTGLSRILRLMTSAAVKNSDAYEMLGVEVFDANGKMNNMADIVEDLENSLGDMSDESRTVALDMLGFKARVQGVILPLIGTSDAIRRYEKELRKAGGTTEEVAAKQMESFLKQMKLVGARIMDVAIGLGATLAPSIKSFAENVLVPAIEKLAVFAKWFGDLPDSVRNTALAIAGIAAVAGPFVLVLGGLVSGIGFAVSGLAALVGAVGAGGLAIAAIVATLGAAVAVITSTTDWVDRATAAFSRWWDSTEEGRKFLVELSRVIASDVVDAVKTVVDWVAAAAKFQVAWLAVVVDSIGRFLEWSGVLLAVKGHIVAVSGAVVTITTALWKLAGGLQGVIETAKVLTPGLALIATKMEDWEKRAKEAADQVKIVVTGFRALRFAAEDTDDSLGDLTAAIEAGLVPIKKTGAEVDDLTDGIKGVADEITLLVNKINILRSEIEITERFFDDLAESADRFAESITVDFAAWMAGIATGKGSLEDLAFGFWDKMTEEAQRFEMEVKIKAQSLVNFQRSIEGAVASALSQAFASGDVRQAAADLMGSIGAAAGNFFGGPIGAVIGREIGQRIGDALFSKGNPGLTAAKKFGLALSEALVSSITDFARALGKRGGADAALRQFLGDAIREVGIESSLDLRRFAKLALLTLADLDRGFISSAQTVSALGDSLGAILERFEDAGGTLLDLRLIGDVFANAIDQVRRGQLTAAEATQILNDNFGAFIDAALTLGPKGAEAIRRVADAARDAGLEISAVTDKIRELTDEALEILAQRNRFLVEQATSLIGGVEALLAATGDANRREIEFTVSAVVSAFNAMMAAGAPILEIIDLLGESFSVILDRGLELGLKLPEAFRRLGEIIDVVSSRRLTRLLDQLDGASAATAALGNMGVLTAGQFDFFGDSVRRAFRRLVAQGLSAEEALAILAPQLQQLNDLSQQYGFELDKNTQSLLDQALAQGVVADKGLSMEDILIKGFDRLLLALNALIEAMGGVPVAFEEWGDAASAAEDDVTRLTEAIDKVRDLDPPTGGRPTDPKVHKPFFRHGSGGLRNFSALGTPAILHGSEEVLTAKQGGGVAAMVSAAISGEGGGGMDLLAGSIDELSRSLIRQQASVEIQRRDESLKSAA